jgi:DNA-directed RNA polymerase subunit RPC12/RpoP
MKCIKCGTDNNLRDRRLNSDRCKRCQHRFVFESTTINRVKITDAMFAKAIADISVNDTLFFTSQQLCYFFGKRFKQTIPRVLYTTSTDVTVDQPKNGILWQILGWIIIVTGFFFSGWLNPTIYIYLISCTSILGMIFIFLGMPKTRITHQQHAHQSSNKAQTYLIDFNKCQSCINQWKAINPIAKMLPPPRDTNENAAISPDVSAYSFDRVVVCDRPEIAQFLIANNFHFENNCAILSVTGYPQSIFDTIMQMLRRNPDLKVYALHDCSPRGIALVNHLRNSPTWFSDSSTIIIDIGLLPRQIMAAGDSMLVLNSSEYIQDAVNLQPEIRQNLSAEELEWLESGNYVELESFNPRRFMQLLHREIAGSRDLDSDENRLILLEDTRSSLYIVDSFG